MPNYPIALDQLRLPHRALQLGLVADAADIKTERDEFLAQVESDNSNLADLFYETESDLDRLESEYGSKFGSVEKRDFESWSDLDFWDQDIAAENDDDYKYFSDESQEKVFSKKWSV